MVVIFLVTLAKRGDKYNVPILEFYGLSTDEKPLYDDAGASIPNGSVFVEMDSLKVFFYETEKDEWITKDK